MLFEELVPCGGSGGGIALAQVGLAGELRGLDGHGLVTGGGDGIEVFPGGVEIEAAEEDLRAPEEEGGIVRAEADRGGKGGKGLVLQAAAELVEGEQDHVRRRSVFRAGFQESGERIEGLLVDPRIMEAREEGGVVRGSEEGVVELQRGGRGGLLGVGDEAHEGQERERVEAGGHGSISRLFPAFRRIP